MSNSTEGITHENLRALNQTIADLKAHIERVEKLVAEHTSTLVTLSATVHSTNTWMQGIDKKLSEVNSTLFKIDAWLTAH